MAVFCSHSFSPVAVTPDELGEAWKNGKLQLTLDTSINREKIGQLQTGSDLLFSFPSLIASLCADRAIHAGTILSTGTVSNADAKKGFASIFEKRLYESSQALPATDFLKFGDQIKIDITDKHSKSIFGAIEQSVVEYSKN